MRPSIAIDILNNNKNIDLILLDIMLPEINGFELCKKIKSNENTKDIPVIFITINSDEASIEEAYNVGGIDYITKPFKQKELLARIQNTLELSQNKKILEDKIKDVKNKLKIEETKKLEQERIILEQSKLVSLGELMVMIAHQWRQPLAELSISEITMLNSIKNDSYDITDIKETIIENLEIIQFMSKTIENFQSFYQVDKSPQEFFIKESIDSVKFLLNETIRLQSITLIEDIDDSISITGLKYTLAQVLLSILHNSIEILALKEIKNRLIKITLNKVDNKNILTIEDNADGIKIEPLEDIFKPFISKKTDTSTGFGLYMAKKIINEKFNGQIFAQNISNGAKFTIILD